jgi:hypothetical protein
MIYDEMCAREEGEATKKKKRPSASRSRDLACCENLNFSSVTFPSSCERETDIQRAREKF